MYEELKKDFSSGHSLPILRALAETGLLQHFLPELCANNHLLLQQGSDFAASVKRIDDLVRAGTDVTPTLLLVLVALFQGALTPDFGEIHTRFHSAEEIEKQVRASFSRLAVPRKERELIAKLLIHWWELLHTPPADLRPGRWLAKPCFPDLLNLLRITGITAEDEARLDLLLSTDPFKQGDEHRRRGRRGGRKRGRMPHRRRRRFF